VADGGNGKSTEATETTGNLPDEGKISAIAAAVLPWQEIMM